MSTASTPLIAGRYRLVTQLGQGGMGRVWLGRDEVLHRDVAIKEVTPPEGLAAEERAAMGERSLREARAIARLAHPNVVRVYDVVQREPWPWIVMEHVPSRSLDQVLRTDGPVPPAQAAHIGLGVLGALRAAHRIGMVHRDVKPANVLLGPDGRVVLTDFGLATLEGDATVTRPGVIIGSPAFMAPERAAKGTSTPACDLWSLGATLYAAVEGRSPFARASALATLTALATEEPDPAPHAGPLRPVIHGLLRRDPEQRMPAAEVYRHLAKTAGAGRQADGAREAPAPPAGRRDPRRRDNRRRGSGQRDSGRDAGRPRATGHAPDQPRIAGRAPAGPPPPTGADAAAVGLPGTRPPPGGEPAPRQVPGSEPPLTRTRVDLAVPQPGDRVALVPAARRLATVARRRGPWLDALVAVLALVGLAALLVTFTPPGLTATWTPAHAPVATGTGPARSPGTRPAPAPPSSPGGATIPAGWHWYHDPTGFSVAVPDGWSRSRQGSIVYFRAPDGSRVLGVDQSGTPKPDPVADWTNQEQHRVAGGDFPGYQRLRIAPVDYFVKAADWEFTYLRGGQRVHVVNRGVITSTHQAYGLWWQTLDSQWDRYLPDLRTVLASFQPRRA